jgi:hypothetical protein
MAEQTPHQYTIYFPYNVLSWLKMKLNDSMDFLKPVISEYHDELKMPTEEQFMAMTKKEREKIGLDIYRHCAENNHPLLIELRKMFKNEKAEHDTIITHIQNCFSNTNASYRSFNWRIDQLCRNASAEEKSRIKNKYLDMLFNDTYDIVIKNKNTPISSVLLRCSDDILVEFNEDIKIVVFEEPHSRLNFDNNLLMQNTGEEQPSRLTFNSGILVQNINGENPDPPYDPPMPELVEDSDYEQDHEQDYEPEVDEYTDEYINKFTIKMSALLRELDSKKCSICHSDYESTDELLFLNCSHMFHAECMYKWGETCPVCRSKN